MQVPLEIIFRNLPPSEFIEARVRERVGRLERLYDGITSCHVAIEVPHRHHHKGTTYHVRIETRVPGTELLISKDPGNAFAHADVYVAVRDAFDAAERQLAEFARKQRGDVKRHETPLQGKIARMFKDHGFITTNDGREIYFHRNSVVDAAFDRLLPDQPVELVIVYAESPHGPQATTVKAIGSMQYVP
jgi:cold shock CspA family protein/ribosome-associated translation inhibitor RaiA